MTRHAALGVAVIGTGRMGADHVRRITGVVSGARVSTVVDIDAARAEGLAEGIVGAALWLVGDAGRYVIGQTVVVDGGWTARRARVAPPAARSRRRHPPPRAGTTP